MKTNYDIFKTTLKLKNHFCTGKIKIVFKDVIQRAS